MFPGAGASVYYNEAGEPLGWDHPAEPDYDPAGFLYGDQDDEPDEDDGMHDYEPAKPHTDQPCRHCGLTDSNLHW